MLGSSAATTIRPPFTPVMAELMKQSAATFMPTCFMQTSARLPTKDMPKAASMAVFSLAAQRLCMFLSLVMGDIWMYSVISVEGVPG